MVSHCLSLPPRLMQGEEQLLPHAWRRAPGLVERAMLRAVRCTGVRNTMSGRVQVWWSANRWAATYDDLSERASSENLVNLVVLFLLEGGRLRQKRFFETEGLHDRNARGFPEPRWWV